ncbi:MAG: bifunctional diguanylate cyclase/phosphodiesterase [Saccharofermentans sp.]|nr:bifunctional diguanylate cyclase/phosphodiesterase [Saccharofermentans sp.]
MVKPEIELTFFLIVQLVLIVYAYSQRKKHIGHVYSSVIKLLLSGLIPIGGNLIAIMTDNITVSYIGYYIFLIGLNVLTYNIFIFTLDYCEYRYRGTFLQTLVNTLLLLSIVSVLMNPLMKHVFVMEEARPAPDLPHMEGPSSASMYVMVPRAGRYVLFAVLMVILGLAIALIIKKCLSISKAYREKYWILAVTYGSCMAITFYFLISRKHTIDRSLIAYVICCYIVYFLTNIYKPYFVRRYLADSVVEHHDDGIIFYDSYVNAIYANDSTYEILEITDKTPDNCTDKLLDIMGGCDISTDFSIATRFIDKDANPRYLTITHHIMTDNKGFSIGSFFNIHNTTEEINRNEKRRWAATHDELTKMNNKVHFAELVDDELASHPNSSYYMIVSDINDFKFINEIYGRNNADQLLVIIANNIKELAHKDSIYCRWGADVFAILARKEDVDLDDLAYVVQHHTDETSNISRPIVIHLGVIEVKGDTKLSVNAMIDRCKLAISSIKNDMNHRLIVYDDKLREERLWEQKVIVEIDGAIKNKEIIPYIQPQYNSEGILEGGEVLVRWDHPTEGLLTPGRFIGILEGNGLISQVDCYIWECACEILSKWKKEGRKMYLSINISPKDFYFVNIYQVITDLVKKYDISPANLHLEITESSVINNASENITTINRLRQAGFIVEMDDFGSGFSSLNMLKDIPVDILKIDMVFLQKTSNYDKSAIILKSIIDMAKALKMDQITEGVETEAQLKMLKDMGCNLFQGYFFSKPVPLDEFEKLPLRFK